MYSLTPPKSHQIQKLFIGHQDTPFSYSEVGMLQDLPAANQALRQYKLDRRRILLGQGKGCFQKAKAALQRWEMFRLGWVQPFPEKKSIEKGALVGVLVKALGIWTLNFCRIVEVIDSEKNPNQFGFVYGTLSQHAEQGEERFLLEWCPERDEVYYEISAFSKPNTFLAKVGYCYTRYLQRKFARDSCQVMLQAVQK